MENYLVPATRTPTGAVDPLKVIQGEFATTPRGVILHGSRSGNASLSRQEEFLGTARYCRDGALIKHPEGWYYVAWTCTIGEDIIGTHMRPDQWGWNAGGSSREYLGVELAQRFVTDAITDGQVRAFCWAFANIYRVRWPNLPAVFPMHSELEQGILAGKSDPHPRGSAEGKELVARINKRLAEMGGT